MYNYLRIARPTDNLERIAAMYRDGLGFEVIGAFANHQGFDGVILGHRSLGYQIEFTQQRGHKAGRAPTQDNLLVFYILSDVEWRQACARMKSAGFDEVVSCNPYWDRNGKTFEDSDGYRVVLQHDMWSAFKA